MTGGVTGILHWDKPSGRTMALGSTQSLIKINTNTISWALKAIGAQVWQPYYISVLIVMKSGNLNLLELCGPALTCIGAALLCFLTSTSKNPAVCPFNTRRSLQFTVYKRSRPTSIISTSHGVRTVQPTRCNVSHFIYFCKTLYMFQTDFPSVISSSKLHIQCQVAVRPIVLPTASLARLAAGSSIGLTLYVQFWAADDGRKTRLKHIERLTEISKLRNVAACWLYSANILSMHGPMNVKQTESFNLQHQIT